MKLYLGAHSMKTGLLLSLSLFGTDCGFYYALKRSDADFIVASGGNNGDWMIKNVIPYLHHEIKQPPEQFGMTVGLDQAKVSIIDMLDRIERNSVLGDRITIVSNDLAKLQMLFNVLQRPVDAGSEVNLKRLKFEYVPDANLPHALREPGYIPHHAYWDAVHLRNQMKILKKKEFRLLA